MKPERWRQIEELYHAALAREPEAWAAFLAEACAGDEELHCEVEALLKYHDQAAGFIETPALELAAKAMAADGSMEPSTQALSQSPIPRQIGPYTLLAPRRSSVNEPDLATSRVHQRPALRRYAAGSSV
jgi:hypothetical protein